MNFVFWCVWCPLLPTDMATAAVNSKYIRITIKIIKQKLFFSKHIKIYVPYNVKTIKHTHTIYKTIHHHGHDSGGHGGGSGWD
ncbi:hypothetical protein RI129_011059 [Pyrocoelia pectoralis]|uniref:Secreted protein n=1 Tax=Pyrocoelia pectoralis TaxID=417401 RepID=A0AAN7V787_9COLE